MYIVISVIVPVDLKLLKCIARTNNHAEVWVDFQWWQMYNDVYMCSLNTYVNSWLQSRSATKRFSLGKDALFVSHVYLLARMDWCHSWNTEMWMALHRHRLQHVIFANVLESLIHCERLAILQQKKLIVIKQISDGTKTYLIISGKPQSRCLVILIIGNVQIISSRVNYVVTFLARLGIFTFGRQLDNCCLE